MLTDYTIDTVKQLSGRELDRAVSVICYGAVIEREYSNGHEVGIVTFPTLSPSPLDEHHLNFNYLDYPPFSTDANLTLDLAFGEGGVLAANNARHYKIAHLYDVDGPKIKVELFYALPRAWVEAETGAIATGSTFAEAVARAMCVVALEQEGTE